MVNKQKKSQLIVLSIAFNYHDSNIAMSINNKIVASLELERLFRAKRISVSISHMEIATRFLLKRFNLDISQVDYLVVNALNNPFENSKEINDIREHQYNFLGRNIPTFIVRHHLAHAGFYYFSGFPKALIASCDGGGDLGERVVYFLGDAINIKRLTQDMKDHISTKPYGQFSSYLYREPFSEGKLMGLSGLDSASDNISKRVSDIFPRLRDVDFASGQALLESAFKNKKGLAKNDSKACAVLASCIQSEFVKRRVHDIETVFDKSLQNLVLVGGSALNLECNSSVFRKITENIYIPPNCDDTGIALGQCAVIIAKLTNKKPKCELPYIGVNENYENYNITKNKNDKNYIIENDPKSAALRLTKNEICLRHFGRAEVGPRALGHRSFLMSPLDAHNREKVSIDVKKREWYRPVAPIIIEEDLSLYFTGGPIRSPYMMFSYKARQSTRAKLPAIVHFDGTSRVQTLRKQDDPLLYKILTEFKNLTGIGMLINTSLNLKGQPITNFLHDTFEIARKIHSKSFICLDYGDEHAKK